MIFVPSCLRGESNALPYRTGQGAAARWGRRKSSHAAKIWRVSSAENNLFEILYFRNYCSLLLRQARELGLHFAALVGHGAGYSDYNKTKQSVGENANYFFDVDPISIWETNQKALKPELVWPVRLHRSSPSAESHPSKW